MTDPMSDGSLVRCSVNSASISGAEGLLTSGCIPWPEAHPDVALATGEEENSTTRARYISLCASCRLIRHRRLEALAAAKVEPAAYMHPTAVLDTHLRHRTCSLRCLVGDTASDLWSLKLTYLSN